MSLVLALKHWVYCVPDRLRETSETEALILSTLGSRVGSSTRNSCLALITLYSSQVFEGRCKQERLLTAITKYFRDFSSKTTCFQDLRPGLSHLDLEGQEHLLLNITTITQDTKPKAGDSEVSEIEPPTILCSALTFSATHDRMDHQRS